VDTEIREDIAATVEPGWYKIPQAVTFSGMSRSAIYDGIRSGEIKSACLRKEGNSRGLRLVNAKSLNAFIESHVGVWSEAPDKTSAEKSGGESQ
jgi:hypothetical protein